ncbi:unnamed protein product, partial [Meganyctiphanes norvegica]
MRGTDTHEDAKCISTDAGSNTSAAFHEAEKICTNKTGHSVPRKYCHVGHIDENDINCLSFATSCVCCKVSCPSPYVSVGNICLWFSMNGPPQTMRDADMECMKKAGRLASLRGDPTNFINYTMQEY